MGRASAGKWRRRRERENDPEPTTPEATERRDVTVTAGLATATGATGPQPPDSED